MLAHNSGPFDNDDWAFELKWDGVRAGAYRDDEGYRVLSRNANAMGASFPELAPLASLPEGTVLDGELVVLSEGKPSLAVILRRLGTHHPLKARHRALKAPATLVVFDCLYSGAHCLMGAPFTERRAEAERLVRSLETSSIVVPEYFIGSGVAAFEVVCKYGLEGLVAKRLDSTYQPGRRCRSWLKIKSGAYQPDVPADDPRWGRASSRED